MADFQVWATFYSVFNDFLTDPLNVGSPKVFGGARDATITDEDGLLELNEGTAFRFTGDGGDIGPYEMHYISMDNGGNALWMAGAGYGGGLLVPTNQIAYDTFVAGTQFGVVSSSPDFAASYDSFYVPPTAPENAAPSFNDGATATLNILEDAGAVSINHLLDITDPDSGDTLSWTIVSGPSKGSLGGFGASGTSNGGSVTPTGLTYTPNDNAFGSDSFVIRVSDGTATDDITVNVGITPVNDPPYYAATGANPTFSEEAGTPVSLFSGSSFGISPDGGAPGDMGSVKMISAVLRVEGVTSGAEEFLILEGTRFALTPGNSGVTTGSVGFSYSVTTDGDALKVTLTSANNMFWDFHDLAYDNESENPGSGPRTITILSVSDAGGTENGGDDTVELTATGPNQNMSVITVVPLDQAPAVTPLTATVGENEVLSGFNLLAGVTDPDSSSFTIEDLTTSVDLAASGGSLVVNGSGLATLDPGQTFDDLSPGETEVLIVSFNVRDDTGLTVPNTLTVTYQGAIDVVDALPGGGELRGTGGADEITGGDGDDEIYGLGGADDIWGRLGNDRISGGDGNDYIDGNAGDDVLLGNAGQDIINGGLGADTIYGGLGDDQLDGLLGDDVIYGGDGDDDIYGGAGDDLLRGGLGNDYITGGLGNDQLYGDAGDDILKGRDGDDILFGGAGFDYIDGDSGDDWLSGGADDDEMYGGSGSDTLFGDAGADYLDGGAHHDDLRGGKGDDEIVGGSGNDRLAGNMGNDRLDGGTGNDVLIGGLGDDLIAGGAGRDELRGDAGADVFVMLDDFAIDLVLDFEDGIDRFSFELHSGVDSFDDLTIVQNGDDAEVLDGMGGRLIVANTDASDLDASDFIFDGLFGAA